MPDPWDYKNRGTDHILNEDGTAEFGGVAATYYPIDCNKVVLINNKTGYGIVIGLMEVEGEIMYFTLKNSVDPNFSRPVKIDDFYKAFWRKCFY